MATRPPSIKSFAHQCHPVTRLLVFTLPANCPLCGQKVDASSVTSPVAQYPSPFVSSCGVPFSVVIKPTVGDFLQSYGQDDNLHTGITTSKGTVYSYDETGVHRECLGWSQCLTVSLLEEYDEDLRSGWDRRLAGMDTEPEWQKEWYKDDGHNCFDFVVGFLNAIGYRHPHHNQNGPITREDFCRDLIMPVTCRAAGYIGIHRSIARYGFLVEQASKGS
ncbi:MKRN2 opposite strand protein-like isoform X2 [Patiria miniata]|nr:MKRN2 opposite strand protein-like isoform X2 [Patiria miniata]